MKKGILVLFLSFVGIALFAQELGKWILEQMIDRFGDPTGESCYLQINMGEGKNSIGSTSSQAVFIGYYPISSSVKILLKDVGMFSFPLNTLFMGPEPITLYIKDSANRTNSFKGNQVSSDDGAVTIRMNDNSNLISLLRQKGSYKAVIEGERWSCSFTFNGSLPQ
jgi:hypothetical protein